MLPDEGAAANGRHRALRSRLDRRLAASISLEAPSGTGGAAERRVRWAAGLVSFDSLDVYAEVGAALAGFATIAGVLRRKFTDRHLAFGVVELSLIAVVFAFVPRMISDIRVSALLFLIAWSSAWIYAGIRNSRHTGVVLNPYVTSRVFHAAALVVAVAGAVFSVLVLLEVWPDRALHFYSSSLACALFAACLFLWLVARTLFYEIESERDE